jgi:hypothetical protein
MRGARAAGRGGRARALHAELLGLGAADGDELAGALAVAAGVAVGEHRRPAVARAHDPRAGFRGLGRVVEVIAV